jgi:hypothetical protein
MRDREAPVYVRLARLLAAPVFMALLALLVTPVAGLAAQGNGAAAGVSAPTQSTLGPKTSGGQPGAMSADSVTGNPYGCYGRSDYPHISQHYPDRVAAQGWTICSVQLPYEHVDSTLYRQDCFFFVCWWTQVGYASNTNGFVYYGAVRAVPSYTCNGSSSHLYEIDSYHEVHDWYGNVYYGFTYNQAWVNCG